MSAFRNQENDVLGGVMSNPSCVLSLRFARGHPKYRNIGGLLSPLLNNCSISVGVGQLIVHKRLVMVGCYGVSLLLVRLFQVLVGWFRSNPMKSILFPCSVFLYKRYSYVLVLCGSLSYDLK